MELKFVFLALTFILGASGAKLPSQYGGYHVTIAVDEDTPTPSAPEQETFRDRVKTMIQTFSNEMWKSTRETFFISSADLHVPSSWNNANAALSTDVTYKTADIRLSQKVAYPNVENPHGCGLSGDFIEFPYAFFADGPGPDEFGTPWKTFMTQWARYRWGVYPEHGYPGVARFPYYYKNPFKAAWEPTGCSNVELTGEHKNFTNVDHDCDLSNVGISPATECRFVPDRVQTATTSLMHFQWLDSVIHFCDHSNHNRQAPNMQNHFCNHRSIWEVIESTRDFQTVTTPQNEVIPTVDFRVTKSAPTPLLYILLDRGYTPAAGGTVQSLMHKVISLFDGRLPDNTLASLGSFPNPDESGSYVREEVPWTTIGASRNDFIDAMGHMATDGPVFRDFGKALIDVGRNIQKRAHKAGAIILVIKTGADPSSYGDLAFEQEVISSIRDYNALVMGAEILAPGQEIGHLKNLVQSTAPANGLLITIKDKSDVEKYADLLLQEVVLLQANPLILPMHFKTIFKGPVTPSTAYLIPRSTLNLDEIKVILTAGASLRVDSDFIFKDPEGSHNFTDIDVPIEWNIGQRKNYMAVLPSDGNATELDNWEFRYGCPVAEELEACSGYLVIYGNREKDGDEVIPPEPVNVEVYTQAVDGIADFGGSYSKDTAFPFTIFAKITNNGVPLKNFKVVATVSKGSINEKIDLLDDGHGFPDAFTGDGIFSGYYIPSSNGGYSVSVQVSTIQSSGLDTRLVPIDQGEISLGGAIDYAKSFARVVDLATPIIVRNIEEFNPGTPLKIQDLEVIKRDNRIFLRFSSPRIIGWSEGVQNYSIYGAPYVENLIYEDLNQYYLKGVPTTKNPGEFEEIPLDNADIPRSYFYTVSSLSRLVQSDISNIVLVDLGEEEPLPTTENPATTPTTTTTTTQPPSGETEDPDQTTTTTTQGPSDETEDPNQTTTTTQPPSGETEDPNQTTPAPGPDPTGAPEEDKKWIEKPEGYLTIIGVIVVILVAGAAIYFYRKKKSKGKLTV